MPPESGTSPIFAKACTKLADFAGQHDVAGERDVGAGAGGDAVDRGHDREGQRAQPAHQRIVRMLERAAEHDLFAGLGEPVIEILAGAEAAAGAGDQQRAATGIRLDIVERSLQRDDAYPP